MPLTEKQYGMFGWKEFHRNRKDILDEFDRAKEYNSSRPVQAEHGNAAEGKIRNWLSDYVPKRFGVTPGYVIPDTVADKYQLRHFDVIIYDAFASPVLWVDGNCDTSQQGKRRAIPAAYVRSVFEVKASLSPESARQAIVKLGELNSFAKYLPSQFSCNTFFCDLEPNLVENPKILPNLVPDSPIVGYWGGIVLRCKLDEEMTGLVTVKQGAADETRVSMSIPIARNLSDLRIQRDSSGDIVLSEQGSSVHAFSDGKAWHFARAYGPTIRSPQYTLNLDWSYNNFAVFALDLLSRLEGVKPEDERRYVFGQVFDVI